MIKDAFRNFDFFFGTLKILFIVFLLFLANRFLSSEKLLIPISLFGIIFGMIFEGKRFCDNSWSSVFELVFWAFCVSLFSFIPMPEGVSSYNFENRIKLLPFWFILTFIIMSFILHGKKVITFLTEGVTLMQSLAVLYWIIDYGFVNANNFFLKPVMVIGVVFSLFSIFHALTHYKLSSTNRLILSIWSSIIMMLLAFDNIYMIFQKEQIDYINNIPQLLHISFQSFFLGVSCVYIVQNLIILVDFLPGSGTFFNATYYRFIEEVKSKHIDRYSDSQVSVLYSFFCILYTSVFFSINYFYQFLPKQTAIWTVFVTFPLLISLYEFLKSKINTANST